MSDHACTLTFVPRISAGRSKVKSGYTPLDLVGLHLLSCAKSGSFGARFFVLLKIVLFQNPFNVSELMLLKSL